MINKPYEYSEEEKVLIDAISASYASLSGEIWQDSRLVSLRGKIKTHYIKAQRTICCYCHKNLMNTNNRIWDLDHVASRKDHPHFMFMPQNLAASCTECNINKSGKQVLLNKRRKKYPSDSKAFKIVHPHFDTYSEHIYVNGMVYVPKSKKGTFTIQACGLLRFAERYIDWGNKLSDDRFEKDVERVFSASMMSEHAVTEIVSKLQRP